MEYCAENLVKGEAVRQSLELLVKVMGKKILPYITHI